MLSFQEKYVNPLTDFGFKKIFGEEPNKDILMAFLNQLLPEQHQIEDLTFARNEQLGSGEVDRRAIFDLYCQSSTGERFIVELQKAKQNFFKDRSVFYSSFPIREQAQRGDWDFRLDAVYTVGILDFIFEDHKEDTDLLHIVEIKNQRNEVFYDKLKYIYVELPKFNKSVDELSSDLDKWLYVLRHLASLDDRPERLRESVFAKLFEVARIANFSGEEREAYQSSLKYYRDLNNVIDTSYQEGHEEGRLEGVEEGIEKGRRLERQNIARQLLSAGQSVDLIAKITGLSAEEVREL